MIENKIVETKKKTTMLMILDGFGLNPSPYGNAIASAKTPHLDKLFSKYPHIRLHASGLDVGLPEGQMGNSEVGHLNIGAGRIVYQELSKITKSIEDGIFYANQAFLQGTEHVKKNDGTLHIFGLLSDGGVHSHIDHIKALCRLAKMQGVSKVMLHCFMDGRDVPPTSGEAYLQEMADFLSYEDVGKIATVSGRFYAMDRDKRWERLEKAYDAIVLGKGAVAKTAQEAIQIGYQQGETDEFLTPSIIDDYTGMSDGDSVIFANFRPDRAREITRALVDSEFDGFHRKKILKNLSYICMTQYDESMPNVTVAFPPHTMKNTLGEYFSKQGLHQLRIAETEKYAHVTFFFNGGVEDPNPLEDRILIPSPKVATYDLQPEMSAPLVTDKVIEELKSSKYDVIILNFANADMVGHTGNFEAAVQAIEALDQCVGKIVNCILTLDGQILLTADHGNADQMLNKDGSVITAHSTNLVPLMHISQSPAEFICEIGKLADIAPTLLTLMGLQIPGEMSGDCLVRI